MEERRGGRPSVATMLVLGHTGSLGTGFCHLKSMLLHLCLFCVAPGTKGHAQRRKLLEEEAGESSAGKGGLANCWSFQQ